MTLAIMALQGAFAEHEAMLHALGVETFQVREASDWERYKDGLIMPGGESTTQRKLLCELGLLEQVKSAIANGLPVFGTCAGLILLAKKVENETAQGIATMNIEACRNAYGRQLGSFRTVETMCGVGESVPMTFIRAPYIKRVGEGVEVLARVDGRIVAARQGRQLVTAFHPELDTDTRVHEYFINKMVLEKA